MIFGFCTKRIGCLHSVSWGGSTSFIFALVWNKPRDLCETSTNIRIILCFQFLKWYLFSVKFVCVFRPMTSRLFASSSNFYNFKTDLSKRWVVLKAACSQNESWAYCTSRRMLDGGWMVVGWWILAVDVAITHSSFYTKKVNSPLNLSINKSHQQAWGTFRTCYNFI